MADQTITARLVEIGVLAERQYIQKSIIPAMQKINLTGGYMVSTYRLIKEFTFTPLVPREYRRKRLQILAGELGKQCIDWRNAYADVGLSVDDSWLRQRMSIVQDEITAYLKTNKLTKMRAIFRDDIADAELIALADQYSTRETEWTPIREWIATELYNLKKVQKIKGSYKTLTTLYLLPALYRHDDLFAGKRKLNGADRQKGKDMFERYSNDYSNNYYVDLVHKWQKR